MTYAIQCCVRCGTLEDGHTGFGNRYVCLGCWRKGWRTDAAGNLQRTELEEEEDLPDDQETAELRRFLQNEELDVEPDEPGPGTWSVYRIHTRGRGHTAKPVCVEWSSNDDNDDGYADEEVAHLTLYFATVEEAIKHTGYTRTGFYGQPVDVFLDGEPLHKPVEPARDPLVMGALGILYILGCTGCHLGELVSPADAPPAASLVLCWNPPLEGQDDRCPTQVRYVVEGRQ